MELEPLEQVLGAVHHGCQEARGEAGHDAQYGAQQQARLRQQVRGIQWKQGRVMGMVARADALRWLRDDLSPDTLLRDQIAGQDLVLGYDDELAGHLADRMAATEIGRVSIVNRKSGSLVGLVARRDLLRVRANVVQHEREREALIRLSR